MPHLFVQGEGGWGVCLREPYGQCISLPSALEQAVPCPRLSRAGDQHPQWENPPGNVNTTRSSWKGNDVVI